MSLVVGRDPSADLQILDELMSRGHTRIEHSASTFYIVDMKSSNGTFVNGKRIERAALKTGDSILLGKTRFEYVGPGAKSPSEEQAEAIQLVDDAPSRPGSTSVIKRVALGDLRRGGSDASAKVADRALETIYEVGNLINAESDLSKVLGAIMDSVESTFEVERAVLFLEEDGELVSRIVRSSGKARGADASRVSRTVVEQCRNEGVSILSSDAMMDDRFKSGDSILLERIRSIMCVPLETAQQGNLGVLYVDNRGTGGAYKERDLELLAAIGKQAGVAIERAMLHEETKKKLTSAITAVVSANEAASPFTAGHSERVSTYCYQIAVELGLSKALCEQVRLAGLLHDVGRALVPREILLKRDRLNDDEKEQVQAHAIASARIVANIHGLSEIVDGVRSHHERFDGSGYPEGLASDAIPVTARIIAVADAYDHMSTNQPQRDALEQAAILEELKACAGTQFDPGIVEICVKLLEAGRLQAEETRFTGELLLS